MKISQLKKVLKEMKSIVDYKDTQTNIEVQAKSVDPWIEDERVWIHTTINDIDITLHKRLNKEVSNGKRK